MREHYSTLCTEQDCSEIKICSPSLKAYIALCGIWGILTTALLCLYFYKNFEPSILQGVFITALIGFLLFLWVRGFRIVVTKTQLQYRDGYYKTYSIP